MVCQHVCWKGLCEGSGAVFGGALQGRGEHTSVPCTARRWKCWALNGAVSFMLVAVFFCVYSAGSIADTGLCKLLRVAVMVCGEGLILPFPRPAVPAYCHWPLLQLSRLLWLFLGFLRQKSSLCTVWYQHIKSSIYAPISLIPSSTSDVHPQPITPRSSASCPRWSCCPGAVAFARVCVVDLRGFSAVMAQPQLLCWQRLQAWWSDHLYSSLQ